jgi:phosphate-selective porin OprO/OprP
MNIKAHHVLSLSLVLTSLSGHTKDYPDIKFNGVVMLDFNSFDANFLEESNEAGSQFDLRRLRLGLKSDISKDWSAKLSIEGKDDIDVKDVYIKYDGWEMFDLTIGKQKEPFGLERLMSSKELFMTERSMMSNAISPDRNYGINVSGEQGLINWQLGYFQNDTDQKSNAITGRLVWSPWHNEESLIHFGTAFSERSLHGETFRINEKLEVYGADSLVEGAKISADDVSLTGFEFLWQNNGFTNMAEWQRAKVSTTDGNQYQYEGGYYQLSYLLSGRNREYKNGTLDNAETNNDWEISMRYSQFKLLQENSEAKMFSVGVNYLLNKDVKFMADYIIADYVDKGENLGSGDAISLRVQYHF